MNFADVGALIYMYFLFRFLAVVCAHIWMQSVIQSVV